MEQIKDLILNYGYIIIAGTLFLELIALPLPGEVMMTYTGFLVGQNQLNWLTSVIFAFLGTVAGMTSTYFIGRLLGRTFFAKYGHYIHMGPAQLAKANVWFEKYGDRLIVVAYFIPGVRHITGYFSGISRLSFKNFALYAYLGGAFWVCTFISMGSILGDSWEKYHALISSYLAIGGIVIATLIILALAYKYYKDRILAFGISSLKRSILVFHSMGRVKFVVATLGFLFIVIFAFAIESIQDFLSNQYDTFNSVIKYFTYRSFGYEWQPIFNVLNHFATVYFLAFAFVICILWIVRHGKDKRLEYIFAFITIWGGLGLQIFLSNLFANSGVMKNLYLVSKTAFPGREGIVAISTIGFLAFMTIRHSGKIMSKALKVLVAGVLVFMIGISAIYNGTLDPSSLIAGLEIGGAWLFLNIVLLEIFRVLPNVSSDQLKSV